MTHRRMASQKDVREIANLRPVSPENEGVAWWGVWQLPKWRPSDRPRPMEPKDR